MICLLIATAFEAGELVDQDQFNEISSPQKILLEESLCLIISGPGPVNAGLSLGLIQEVLGSHPKTHFINVGIAGSLVGADLLSIHYPKQFSFDVGSPAESVSVGLMNQSYPMLASVEGAHLATVPAPLWDKSYGQLLAKRGADLVDMEGYVFARWAELNKTEMNFVKIISDNGDEDQRHLFMTNARRAVDSLAEGLKRLRSLISKQETVNLQELKKCFGSKI